jgi:hypothetical protein
MRFVTINQLFNTTIQTHAISTDSDIEWDGELTWTLITENGFVMVHKYDQQEVAMFIVKRPDDEQFEREIDQILATFSVNI